MLVHPAEGPNADGSISGEAGSRQGFGDTRCLASDFEIRTRSVVSKVVTYRCLPETVFRLTECLANIRNVTMNENENTPHPGRILLQRAMEPLGISRNQLARDLDVPVGRISDITNGKRGITADTALRLGRYFSTGPEIWLRMQAEYDLSVARASTWSAIEDRVRVLVDTEDRNPGEALAVPHPSLPPSQPPSPPAVEVEEPVIINPAPTLTVPDAGVAVAPDTSSADKAEPEIAISSNPSPVTDRDLELRESWVQNDAPREDDIGIPPVPGNLSGKN